MTSRDQLSSDFRSALNAELTALGCRLSIAERTSERAHDMLLLAGDGSELGWIPDHSDAPVIAAFEQILEKVGRHLPKS